MGLARHIRENAATLVVGAVVTLGLALAFVLLNPRAEETGPLVARVHDADGATYELPLAEDGELVVETSLGRNVIVVSGGSAAMHEADCPNGDCLRQQPIYAPGKQLICLPHKLWVEIVEQGAPDGELDVSAVSDADDEGVDLVSR